MQKLKRYFRLAGSDELVPVEQFITETHEYYSVFMDTDLNAVCQHIANDTKSGKTPGKDVRQKVEQIHPYFLTYPSEATAYINRTIDETHGEKNGSSDVPGSSVLSLVRLQQEMKMQTGILLDQTNPKVAALPYSLKSGIYCLTGDCADTDESSVTVSTTYHFPVPKSIHMLRAAIAADSEYANRVSAAAENIPELSPDEEIPEAISGIIDAIPAEEYEDPYIEYPITCLEDVLRFELLEMLTESAPIKRCEECGRYFCVSKGNDRFCNFQGKDGKSCLIKNEDLEGRISKIYTQAYRTHFARVKAGKETKEDLDEWRKMAKDLKKEALSLLITPEEYKRILMEKAAK